MSRALDKHVLAALQKQDASAAYQAISEVLVSPSPNDGLLEIEILGGTHGLSDGTFVLQDGQAVGVSKLGLVGAFLVARKMLASHMDGTSLRTDDELSASTAVILLMDPEYLTAANTRKRVIQQASGRDDIRDIVSKEKHFVDSLLTSRLHRHTKSPTLWNHRRWLVQSLSSFGMSTDVLADLTNIVFVAGERHPRNYYAWCHGRFLMGLKDEKSDKDILAAVKTWSFKHHTDISGWSFLYFLLGLEGSCDVSASPLVLAEVLALAESLRLTNESVWVFLRTLAASRRISDQDYQRFLHANQEILESAADETSQRVLRAAASWCVTYRVKA